MEVTTPSATMGIRGTTVLVDIQTVQGVTTVAVSLNTDPDGGLGEIVITDLDGNEITTITTTDTKWVVPVGDEAYEVERTADDLAEDSIILADAATAYATALARLEAGQSLVELDSSSNRSGSGDNDSETGAEADLGDDGDESGGGGDDSGGQDPEGATPSPDIGPDPTKLDGNDAPVPLLIRMVIRSPSRSKRSPKTALWFCLKRVNLPTPRTRISTAQTVSHIAYRMDKAARRARPRPST